MPITRSRFVPLALVIALLALCTGFLLSGCHNNDDQEVRTALENQLTINDDDLADISSELNKDKTLSAYHVKLGDYVGTLLQGYTYNIDSIDVDGDEAKATVTITARDFSLAIESFGQDLKNNDRELKKLRKAKKTKELQSGVSAMLKDELAKASGSTHSSSITVDLEHGNDGWELDDHDAFLDSWYDAMFGQALDELKSAVK
jgi:hypothetical protein